jgi:hypothetical protein
MTWIKRNLFFVIGSGVAVVLLGLAGYFLYAKWALNEEILGKLNQDYEELRRLAQEKPHPGGGQVDNVKLAKEQQQQLREFIQQTRQYFQRVAPIPDEKKVSDPSFSVKLSQTIARMQTDATNASVGLPPNYNFSFEAQKSRLSYAPGSTEPLAMQLGEVKMICDLLFKTKVNALDSIRRERVSLDDNTGPQTDYLGDRTVTNELALITPYEVVFKCFSTELASVLTQVANSPHGLIVKTINVEQAPAQAIVEPVAATPAFVQVPTQPVAPVARPADEARAAAAAMAQRYGLGPDGMRPYRGVPQPPPVATPPVAAPASKGGLPTVLDEKQLKVTMMLNLVKLLPSKDK